MSPSQVRMQQKQQQLEQQRQERLRDGKGRQGSAADETVDEKERGKSSRRPA